ncbi:MAG: DUF2309 domain-containing protein [Bacteroidetes bacterium]|nr:DUF2309 domain-containing protein [Bacteroidota bacterium]
MTITETMVKTNTTEAKHSHAHTLFDEEHVLYELKHYLPSQTPIKDFIHHNTLHAFQHMKFYDAIFKAGKIFGYQVHLQLSEFRELYKIGRIKKDVFDRVLRDKKGADAEAWKEKLLTKEYDVINTSRLGLLRTEWKNQYKIDLDNSVHPLLFRILCSYLDQGVALWNFPVKDKSFLAALQELEKNSFVSFFKTKRAKQLLQSGDCGITELLKIVVGKREYFEQYLFDQQFSHQGWSGIAASIEAMPHTLLDRRNISLHDLIVVELLFEIDALDFQLSEKWEPLANRLKTEPVNLFADVGSTEMQEVIKLWQDTFEWSYYDEVLTGISLNKNRTRAIHSQKNFQAIFCIDERECSLRRHVESADKNCETFGTPGFFSVEFFFQAENANFYDKLCPAPVTPKYLIKEFGSNHKREHEFLYTKNAQTLLRGFFVSVSMGFAAGGQLFLNLFKPKMSPAISNAFAHMHSHSQLTIENKSLDDKENDLQIGFTIEEMTNRVESLLRSIGLVRNFAPVVYAIAHGSSSANNPHHSAHDCGACSGKPGSVNARVFAFMANHKKVRELLRERGISIPDETQFVGSMHDTASDQIGFYDEAALSEKHTVLHAQNKLAFETALNANAKERTRRFASINTKQSLTGARESILQRSVSMFEPRPELGHGTNTLCIIGSREITKGLFLDRRAFMNSYNYANDPDGKLLTGVMRPIGLVCGGINLEYYFSRVDNYKLGAGTKLPHNVMGLIGVANSADGDLRPGLPVQMIEVHDPVRLLIIVEHLPEIILKAVQSAPEVYEWYINEWVHLVALNPEDGRYYYFNEGTFKLYEALHQPLKYVNNFEQFVEQAKEMETNEIVDATQENLPVYLLN